MTIVENRLTDICLTIAERMKDPVWMGEISLHKENLIPVMNTYPWDITSLSHGYPGFIILFSELDTLFPNLNWDLVAHQYIQNLMNVIEEKGIHNSSLFSGLSGICFSLYLASKKGTRYQKIITQLNAILIKKIKVDFLDPIEEVFKSNQLLSPFQYDVIAGISGLLGYVLEFLTDHSMRELALSLVKALTNLNRPMLYKGIAIPGWYIPREHLILEQHQSLYPEGCFDTGIAHGIAGCLLTLSNAYLKGIIVDNQIEAIEAISSWLQKNKTEFDQSGPLWPSRFGLNFDRNNQVETLSQHCRDAWCYGAPGIALSLYQASKALKSDRLRRNAIEVLIGVCKRFRVKKNLECVTFCHGLAGLLTMLHSMFLETRINIFSETTKDIVEIIIAKYNSSHPFGFKSEASVPNSNKNQLIDNAGLLDGAAGALLSLLFSTSNKSRDWTKIFLIN